MQKRMLWISVVLMIVLALAAGCGPAPTPSPEAVVEEQPTAAPEQPTDVPEPPAEEIKLVAFHAGSLTLPMKALAEAFQAQHPEVTFETEASGSNDAARKISELGREADLML